MPVLRASTTTGHHREATHPPARTRGPCGGGRHRRRDPTPWVRRDHVRMGGRDQGETATPVAGVAMPAALTIQVVGQVEPGRAASPEASPGPRKVPAATPGVASGGDQVGRRKAVAILAEVGWDRRPAVVPAPSARSGQRARGEVPCVVRSGVRGCPEGDLARAAPRVLSAAGPTRDRVQRLGPPPVRLPPAQNLGAVPGAVGARRPSEQAEEQLCRRRRRHRRPTPGCPALPDSWVEDLNSWFGEGT